MPLNTEITNASELAAALGPAYDTISRWNADAQQTEGWINIWGGVGDDFPIKQGESYEIQVRETTTLTVTGNLYSNMPEQSLINNGMSGRNWIGFVIGTTLTKASEVMTSIGSTLSLLRHWDAASQSYEILSNTGGTDFSVKPGEGYESHVTATTTWTPA